MSGPMCVACGQPVITSADPRVPVHFGPCQSQPPALMSGISVCSVCGWTGVPTAGGDCPVCVEVPVTERLWQAVLAEPRTRIVRRHVRQRVGTSIGRNEPCPCGSGRKAKRCCHA